jgi:hypothetical protein
MTVTDIALFVRFCFSCMQASMCVRSACIRRVYDDRFEQWCRVCITVGAERDLPLHVACAYILLIICGTDADTYYTCTRK